MDKIGKCERCKRNNVSVHLNVWLKPRDVYICEDCRIKWTDIYRGSAGTLTSNADLPEAFRIFVDNYIPKFIFR